MRWRCFHHEECRACGKKGRFLLGEDCPEWHPASADEQQALDEEIARRDAARQQWRGKPPVISGPQSYRRTRAES